MSSEILSEFLENSNNFCKNKFTELIHFFVKLINSGEINCDNIFKFPLFENSNNLRKKYYNDKVFLRGLIEFSNYCKNDCYYCGIRASNKKCQRYRMKNAEILSYAENGYKIGFRTFVLQGGEDSLYFSGNSDYNLFEVVEELRIKYPDCAITLSVGELDTITYNKLFELGVNRFLLRHETADELHYKKLHPDAMLLSNRKKCLATLKEIGFQTGAGFMVGSPFQTENSIAEDLLFLRELHPEMVGIGPFIKHSDTPFYDFKEAYNDNFKLIMTLLLLATVRILLPKALIPATTALGTIDKKGYQLGLFSGANVIMPNISSVSSREKYLLYDGKNVGDEVSSRIENMKNCAEKAGLRLVWDRGDFCDCEKD